MQFFGANAFVERLTFAELEFTASTGLTGFLTLNLACVTSEETVLLQYGTILCVDFAKCASDTHTGCFCLTVNATTISLDQAPESYQEFDSGVARKYVIDPHGMVRA